MRYTIESNFKGTCALMKLLLGFSSKVTIRQDHYLFAVFVNITFSLDCCCCCFLNQRFLIFFSFSPK